MDIETAFIKYHNNMQRHISFFCGDEEAAKDAVSQAFASAWMRRILLEAMPEPAMKAWLYAAARNAAVDIKRKESRSDSISGHDLPGDESWEPTDKLAADELMRLLPPELSIPVHMKYYQGMNATEIGESMGLPPATVRTRLRKAMVKMRESMRGDM